MEIIEGFHLLFIANSIGTSVLTPSDKKALKSFGVDWKQVPIGETKFDHSFKFGILAEVLGHDTAKVMTYKGLKKFLKSGKFPPLTAVERETLEYVKKRAYNDVKGLGTKIATGFSNTLLEIDQKNALEFEKILNKEAIEAIKLRKTKQELASALAKKTGDWARDFNKISDYVLHLSFENGKVSQILKVHGKDAEVWFDVYAGACNHCKTLYLKPDGKPKVFKLKTIISNGSNIGRKSKQWKATIPPIHPYCRCNMNHKKEGFEWDENTKSFTKPIRNTKNIKRTSQPKIVVSV